MKILIDEKLQETNIIKSTSDSGEREIQELNLLTESGKAAHLIALFLGALGFIPKELEYHVMAINLKESGRGESQHGSVSLSDSYNCMGLAYDNLGDFEEAMICYDRALTYRRTLLGNSHLKVAETCHSMVSII